MQEIVARYQEIIRDREWRIQELEFLFKRTNEALEGYMKQNEELKRKLNHE